MKNNRNHGFSNTKTYTSWEAMRARCIGNHPSRKQYGDKGISIDPRWDDFLCFLEDMGERPEGTSLDRIDGTKGYFKENCRWATKIQQNQNTSRCVFINYKGEKLTISEVARREGICERTLHSRIKKHKDPQKWFLKEKLLSKRTITFNGVSQSLTEWANYIGISPSTLHIRLEKYPIEKALTQGRFK